MYFIRCVSLLVVLVVSGGCAKPCDTRSPTWKLDAWARRDPSRQEFVNTVKEFYAALERKDWEAAYKYRTKEFKHDCRLPFYLKSAQRGEKGWSLKRYEVLEVNTYPSVNIPSVRLIMKFQEGGLTYHNVVWWRKEDEGWRCPDAGPSGLGISGLGILNSTRTQWHWMTE